MIKFYRVSYLGFVCVAKKRIFSNKYILDFGITCERHEIEIESRIYPPFCSKDLRNSPFNTVKRILEAK